MDWKTYEETVKNIHEVLGKGVGVKIECWGNDCKRKGKSQVPHQIDVLTSHTDGLHQYYTAIECKYWNDKINKDIVMKVESIVADCGFNKGVIVSKIGFTEDAITYAKFRNIELVELRESADADWDGRVKDIIINIHIQSPSLLAFVNVVDGKLLAGEVERTKFIFTADYFYQFPDGSQKTVKEIAEEFLKSKVTKLNETIEEKVDFPQGTTLKSIDSGYSLPVIGIKLKGVLNEAIETVEIRGERYISMIMKTVFAGKRFVITKELEIREVPSQVDDANTQ